MEAPEDWTAIGELPCLRLWTCRLLRLSGGSKTHTERVGRQVADTDRVLIAQAESEDCAGRLDEVVG